MIDACILLTIGAPRTTIAGLTVLDRNAAVLFRAGIRRLLVVGNEDDKLVVRFPRPTPGTTVEHLATVEDAMAIAAGPVAIASCESIYDPAQVRLTIATVDASRHLATATATAIGAAAAAAAEPRLVVLSQLHDVRTPAACQEAERLLFRSLRKPVDGWVSRNINRYLSLSVTRFLVKTSVTPNQLTIVTSLIGALGVWLVLRSTWTSVAAGAVLVQLQSVLDGCDGEVARLKFQSSRFGEWLDNVLDDFVNIGFGLALGIASAKLFGSSLYCWLGATAAVSFLAYNSLVYAQLALVHHTGNPFAFRWWFQREGADLTRTLGQAGGIGRIGAVLRTLGRRDTFLLCFMLLAIVRLPHIAVVWYAAVGIADLLLTLAHLVVRIGERR
ncbi:MAG: CDP-alcohol phosphatidyltransferase family protein [Pseudomonadota bacterium]